MSKQETKGDSGIEILVNEPYDDPELGKGQYTHKIYHLGSKVPGYLRALCPSSALRAEEKAWNSYPYCRTTFSNGFLQNRFNITVETWHKDNDIEIENVHELPPDLLAQRQVIYLDIANSKVDEKDYSVETDPKVFLSEKTGRGRLGENWIQNAKPRMCCYKLITIKFKSQDSLLLKFHRLLFCLIDKWFGLTMDDIRRLEDQAKKELDDKIASEITNGDTSSTGKASTVSTASID